MASKLPSITTEIQDKITTLNRLNDTKTDYSNFYLTLNEFHNSVMLIGSTTKTMDVINDDEILKADNWSDLSSLGKTSRTVSGYFVHCSNISIITGGYLELVNNVGFQIGYIEESGKRDCYLIWNKEVELDSSKNNLKITYTDTDTDSD